MHDVTYTLWYFYKSRMLGRVIDSSTSNSTPLAKEYSMAFVKYSRGGQSVA